MNLIKNLIMEQELHALKVELQEEEEEDMIDGQGYSVVEFCILFQSVPNNVDGRVHWHGFK